MLETQASIAKACSRSSAVIGSKYGIWPANMYSSWAVRQHRRSRPNVSSKLE